jgi:hypothetical protein
LAASLAKLDRAVAALTDEAQGLRKAAVTLEEETARHPRPTFRPAVAAAAARVRETQAILAETNPSRNMTVLVDGIAGIYLIIGATLLTLAHAVGK